MRRYNPKTGLVENVDEFDKKKPEPPSSTTVDVISPQGLPGTVPSNQVEDAISQGFRIETADEKQERLDVEKFGGRPIAAGAAGLARGATLGLSDVAARALGAEELFAGLRRRNIIAGGAGEVVGSIGTGLVGEAALAARGAKAAGVPLAEYLAARTGQSTLSAAKGLATRGAAEGAIFGAGSGVSDVALSSGNIDPAEAAEHIVSSAGYGAVIGGVTGGAFGLAGGAIRSGKNKVKNLLSGGTKAEAVLPPGVPPPPGTPSTPFSAKIIGESVGQPSPTDLFIRERATVGLGNLDEVAKAVDDIEKFGGGIPELPEKAIFEDAVSRLPDAPKPLAIHTNQLSDAPTFRIVRAARLAQPGETIALDKYEAIQKQFAQKEIKKLPESLGVGRALKPFEAGNELLEDIQKQLKAKKLDISEKYAKFNQISDRVPTTVHLENLKLRLGEDLPDIRPHLQFDPKGALVLSDELLSNPGRARLSSKELTAVKKVLNLANSKNVTVQELLNINDELRKIQLGADGTAPLITKIRNSIRNHAEDLTETVAPGTGLRDALRANAKKEEYIERVTDLIRGVEGGVDGATPEKIIKQIFSNSQNIVEAKELFGEAKFNELARDYLQTFIDKSTNATSGVVSARQLLNEITKNELPLSMAVGKDRVQRLKDLAIYQSGTADTAPVNPSGTAATKQYGEALGSLKRLITLDVSGALQQGAGVLDALRNTQRNIGTINQALAGQKITDEIIKKTDGKILSSIKSFFSSPKTRSGTRIGVTVAAINKWGPEYKRKLDTLASSASNPDTLTRVIQESLVGKKIDDSLAASIGADAVKSILFLNSKAPKQYSPNGVADKDNYRPSDAEVAKFNRYVRAVDNPLSVLEDFQDGILTAEAVEAVMVTKPALYQKMVGSALDELSKQTKELSYQKKIQLSVLLGYPASKALSPEFVLILQQGLPPPGQKDGAVKPSVGGLKEINRAEAVESPLSKVLNR